MVPTVEIAELNPPKGIINAASESWVHFVSMASVSADFGGIDISTTRPLKEVAKGYTAFRARDVLFAKITPCMENGKIAVVPELEYGIGFGSTEFHVLRSVGALQPRLLAYYLSQTTFRRSARRSMTGSAGQLRVPSTWLAEQLIPVPPLNEQRRIVAKIEELFSDLDAGVAALERIRANLKRYRAAVLKAAVEGQLTQAWRAKHPHIEPATKLLERILAERRRKWEENQLAKFAAAGKTPPKGWREKYIEPAAPDTNGLPELPPGWCWATLETLADLVGGITKDKKRADQPGMREVPYLRVANVQRGFLDLSEMKVIAASPGDIADLRLEVGDVLFTEGGDRDKLGRGWVWAGELTECIHQNHIFRARFFSKDMQPRFVSHQGNTFGQEWFTNAGKQTTNLASINLGILRRFPVPIPPAEEQKEIVVQLDEKLSQIEAAIIATDHSLKRAARLRQSILKRAFEGKLVPQDPNDEPAEKLLERIRCARETASGSARETTSRTARNGKERRRTKKK